MHKFSKAIVRTPGRSMVSGITEANLGAPDYEKALGQHRAYIEALEDCGLEVHVLAPDEVYPDSTFVEDAAILTEQCAIITRPAAPSRTGETESIRAVLESFYPRLEEIADPGTLDGGDVMQIEGHFYIGLSARTNREGAEQLITILERYGMSASTVPVEDFLHLKTGVTYVADNTLLAAGEFLERSEFSGFTIYPLDDEDAGGVNCICINDKVVVPAGYPKVSGYLIELGQEIVEVDISEFAKLDGGLTCLSLRF